MRLAFAACQVTPGDCRAYVRITELLLLLGAMIACQTSFQRRASRRRVIVYDEARLWVWRDDLARVKVG